MHFKHNTSGQPVTLTISQTTTTPTEHCRYFDAKRTGSYGGVAALNRASRTPVRFIKKWLPEQDTYTLHKPVRTAFKRRCVVVGGPH